MSEDLLDSIAKLAWVEAMQQVQYTLHRATRALGYGPPEDWADCFTPEGTYKETAPEFVDRYSGFDELKRYAADCNEGSPALRHWIMAPDIEIHGDTARVTSVMGAFDSTPEANLHVALVGRFIDEFVRCADGRWRIAAREAQIQARRT